MKRSDAHRSLSRHGASRQKRSHAEVWVDQYGPAIHDLGSQHGTCINGVWVDHVQRAGLVIADAIYLGGVEIEVVGNVRALGKHPANTQKLAKTVPPPSNHPPGRQMCRQLSAHELDVLLWISRGYDDEEEIGRKLHRSASTIHTQLTAIFNELGIHTKSGLMGWLRGNIQSLYSIARGEQTLGRARPMRVASGHAISPHFSP
jgi:DNA-binding CsgD family transcriptional regulator